MERANRILKNIKFNECLKKINECEKERIFCKHGLGHLLDVARIAYIINLEEGYQIDREIVYATALLHDCGKYLEYEVGIPHNISSAEISEKILEDSDFKDEEIGLILSAIRSHRNPKLRDEKTLNGLIYRADKMSRTCFECEARGECNWSEDKMNHQLIR